MASEFDQSGTLIRSYLFEPNREWQERLLAVKAGGNYFYSMADHLGTPQRLIGKDAAVGWSANYKAYGLATPTTELVTNPLRFPGQYFDSESGLHQNYMRDYDPGIGAYGTQDPIGVFRTGSNRYGYVYGNPVHRYDPKGLSPGDMDGDDNDDGIQDGQEIKPINPIGGGEADLDGDGQDDILTIPLLGGAAKSGGGGRGSHVVKPPVPPSAPPALPGGGCSIECPPLPDKWVREPATIQDRMTLDAARKGAGRKIKDNLADPRFPGMEKWEYKVKSNMCKDSVVHYVRDPKTGELMDFKFKKRSIE